MHKSVLLEEALTALNLKEDSLVVDMTLGFAGHSSAILKRIKKGHLFAFDQDEEALAYSKEKLASIGKNVTIFDANFKDAKAKLEELGIKKVDAILYDLGVSSPQLDEDYRGFSYHKEAKLDMRMDQDNPLTAYDIVNKYEEKALAKIFLKYGESKYASRIAKQIVKVRSQKEIVTTLELVEVIKSCIPYKERIKKHPAKQIFQALRIEVNQELEVLEQSLNDAISLLNKNGRIVVISFHSLEDRLVKQKFLDICKEDPLLKGMPSIPLDKKPSFRLVTKKGVKPSSLEQTENPRSHSAIMRVVEKIK